MSRLEISWFQLNLDPNQQLSRSEKIQNEDSTVSLVSTFDYLEKKTLINEDDFKNKVIAFKISMSMRHYSCGE